MMKKSDAAAILCVCLGISTLAGCAQTPEESLVKRKGESIQNYEEAEGTSEETSEETPEEAQAANIRSLVGAPETWKSEAVDETGRLKILTDAEVEIPDVQQVPVFSVRKHPFDQETMDRITETFFGDAPVYSGDSYYTRTKDEVLKELTTWKGYLAEGNLDPYNRGKDENGNYFVDIYQIIEELEAEYETAPEERTLAEVHPQFGLEVDDGAGGTYIDEDYFSGVAFLEGSVPYQYIMSSYNSMPMSVKINRLHQLGESDRPDTSLLWSGYDGHGEDSPLAEQLPSQEELKQEIGISYEDAKAIADEKVASLQIPDMELAQWEYGLGAYDGDNDKMGLGETGYILHYTRNIGGIPVTYTTEVGGALESMESEMETWGYEYLDICVTKDGIDRVEFYNQYDMGETKAGNVKLKSFEEIMDIYEKMMLIQNADILNYEGSRTYYIDRIAFGYSRIYEPATDSGSGTLVPVWDFFGSFRTENTEEQQAEGAPEFFENRMRYQSYLTINAIDGSVINRALGY